MNRRGFFKVLAGGAAAVVGIGSMPKRKRARGGLADEAMRHLDEPRKQVEAALCDAPPAEPVAHWVMMYDGNGHVTNVKVMV